jgi:hypothetical protein
MTQTLVQIEYRRGLLEEGMKREDLPLKAWRGSDIPSEVRKAVTEEGMLNLGGTYGDKSVGDPVEYDYLKLVLTDDVVEFTIFNRGIMLFATDDDCLRRIHRFLCKLE